MHNALLHSSEYLKYPWFKILNKMLFSRVLSMSLSKILNLQAPISKMLFFLLLRNTVLLRKLMHLLNEFKRRGNDSAVYQESPFLYLRTSFERAIRKAIVVF